MKLIVSLFLLGTSLFSPVGKCDVTIIHGVEDDLLISGQVTPSDYNSVIDKIEFIERNPRHFRLTIFLNSIGGDLDTAIKIGKYLRKKEANTVVSKNYICASSCVFILAGGVAKLPDGKVYIHRPYFEDNHEIKDATQLKVKYQSLAKYTKSYLEEMNVQAKLFDDMISINSSSSKLLSKDELTEYGLIGADPYWEESIKAKKATSSGISMTEYIKREKYGSSVCDAEMYREGAAMNKNGNETPEKIANVISKRFDCVDDFISGKRKE